MPKFTGLYRILSTIRSPVYGRYLFGTAISNVGTWMQRVGIGWLTWSLTGSTTWLGIIAFLDLIPAVFIGPFAGTIADRWDRMTLIKVTQILASLQATALFVLTLTGWIDILGLAALTLFHGIVMAFNQPARMALLPSLVKRQHFNTAIGLNSVTFNIARFVGPALAGLIIVGGELAWVFAANALSFLIFLVVLYRLRIDAPTKPARSGKRFLSDVSEGLRFSLREPRIALPLSLMVAVSAGARPVAELLPGIAAALLSGDAGTLALLTSTMGLGAIFGGLWLAGRRRGGDLSSVVTLAAVAIGVWLLTLATASALWIALPAAAFLGAAQVVTGAGTQTLLQLNVPGEMRGRVMSLYGLIVRGGPAIGALVMGAAAEWSGLRWPLAAGAVIVAGAALILRRRDGWHG